MNIAMAVIIALECRISSIMENRVLSDINWLDRCVPYQQQQKLPITRSRGW